MILNVLRVYIAEQARSQGTFDVKQLQAGGLGAALRPPMGSGRNPGGGPGGEAPGS